MEQDESPLAALVGALCVFALPLILLGIAVMVTPR
jgi:hypothetical protein